MEHNKDMEDLFKDSFENFEVEPPEEIKIAIDKRLKFTDKRKFSLFGLAGIVALITVIISSVFLFNTEEKSRSKQISKNKINQVKSVEEDKVKLVENSKKQENLNLAKTGETKTTSPHTLAKDETTSETTLLLKNKTIKKVEQNKNNKQDKIKKQTTNFEKKKTRNELTSVEEKSKISESKELGKVIPITNETNTINSENVVSNEKKEENLKKDTTAQTQSSVVKDSSQSDQNGSSQNTKPAKKTPPLLFALKSDYLFSAKKSPDKLISLDSRNSFNFQLEATYLLNTKVGLSSGINYFTSLGLYSKSTIMIDSTLTDSNTNYIFSDSLQYIYDSNQVLIDSVLITYISDSITTNTYQVSENKNTQSSRFIISSFSVPLLFYYNQKLSTNLSLDLMAGGIISFQKMRFKDNSNPLNNELELNKTGFKALLKTSLRYQFTNFGVSLNNSFSYDLKPIRYAGNQGAKFSYGLGVGIFWKL